MDNIICSCCIEVYSSNYDTQEKIHANLVAYLAFLDEEIEIQEFLAYDICSIFADKYLLAVIFKYFMRLNMGAVCFNKVTFFTALNIAYDVYEDKDKEIKDELYMWALGPEYESRIQEFTDSKIRLFYELGFRALVCREWCEMLFELVPSHPAWKRNREEGHSGARRFVMEEDDRGSFVMKMDRGECTHCQRRNQLLRDLPEINMNEE